MKQFLKNWGLHIVFLQALVAFLGSMYFSNIAHYPPCVLCWYQRICMYPLVIISGVAILELNKKVARYVLPLAGIGWLISLYHNLLYYKILPEAAAPCMAGISCTTKYIQWLGFITIPLLAFIAFTIIIIFTIIYNKLNNQHE